MAVKAILVLCSSALFVQAISAQCLGNIRNAGVVDVVEVAGLAGNGLIGPGYGWAGNGLAAGYGAGLGWAGNGLAAGYGAGWAGNGLAAAELAIGQSGGPLPISSASPIAPTGLSVASENLIEGPLVVSGQLPFLAAVALEGQVPSSGVAGVSYGCGNGNIGIVSEGLAAAEVATGLGYGAGLAGVGLAGGLGYGAGLAGGLGYGSGLAGGRIGRGGCGCGSVLY